MTSAALIFTLSVSFAGCGKGPTDGANSSEPAISAEDDSSGFRLPPGYMTVNITLEKRKEVFKKAHWVRALAVQEANLELPRDEAHLPHLDTKAFEKRVADHKVIIIRILGKNLLALAEKYKISVSDVERIEDEANKLRWFPPADPVFKPEEPNAESKARPDKNAEPESKDSKLR